MLINLRRKAVYKFDINPYTNVGEIFFGASRESIRKVFGTYKEFKKSKASKNTTDDFEFCHIYYDTNNKCEAIEYFPDLELLYKKRNLFEMNFNDFSQFALSNSIALEENDMGVLAKEIGIAIYAPEREKIESILVYKKGYYDKE
jgi:hypothetical protein